jgi:S1-C subfamily serine protease
MIELGISVELGCSGGPAFDASGHVFGMVHSRRTEGSGAAKSYVLPINLVLRIAKELIDNEPMAS